MTPASNRPDRDDLEEALAIALAENVSLRAQNAALLEIISKLEARIATLERRLGLNSANSSKPPSSDGPKKPARTSSLRQPSGKKSGGQKGHKGETLRQTATPDDVVDHHPQTCGGCGAALTQDVSEGHAARQVFDLPEPQPLNVTEHRAHVCRCGSCGQTTRAAFPEGVDAPVQYGARIAAFVVYLLHYQFIPEDRLKQLMSDLFDVSLSCATIAGMSRNCASRLEGFAEALRDLVAGADVKHMDETGFRIGGKTQWLHVACTALLTFYRVCAKRGSLLANVVGVVVHDHWKPYYTMTGVLHALCNAHHLRELKALVDIEKEDWARQMQILLRRACHAANLARQRDVPLNPRFIARIKRRYDAIVRQGLAFHEAQPPLVRTKGKSRGPAPRRTGHNLLARLDHRKEDVLRFLDDPNVPFTNNQAEGDVRMMKVKQKISGGFRSEDGAKDFAIIRSVISTARKQGWNILQTLMRSPDALIQDLRAI
ncbi:MAG TPA: IS66 family transposase [Hyphomicrobium sp.]|jgi:transposase